MSELGDVLELMSTAHRRFRTVRAVVRTWRHAERSEQAFRRLSESRKGGSVSTVVSMVAVTTAESAEPPPETTEDIVRLWAEKPSRMREEREGDSWYDGFSVQDGDRWWSYTSSQGALSSEDPNTGTSIGHQAEHLLDPSSLLGSLELDLLGTTELAGRPAYELRGVPRAPRRDLSAHELFMLGPGADEYQLAVDREQGVLLRVEAKVEGAVFQISEMVEVAFDEDFPPETFVFVPPPGETVREPVVLEHDLTVDEAADRAPFTVFVPSDLPDDLAAMYVLYHPADPRGGQAAFVSIGYRSGLGVRGIGLHETAAGEQVLGAGEWELVTHGGYEYRVLKQGDDVILRFDREETTINMDSGSYDLEWLLELAGSLVPVER